LPGARIEELVAKKLTKLANPSEIMVRNFEDCVVDIYRKEIRTSDYFNSKYTAMNLHGRSIRVCVVTLKRLLSFFVKVLAKIFN